MAERYQREIEEILAEADVQPPRRPPEPVRSPRPARSQRRGFSCRPGSGSLAFAGVVFLAAALALNLLGFSGTILLWPAVALFAAAYVAYFAKPRRTVERRWRGQVMDSPPPPGPLSRLWRRITGG